MDRFMQQGINSIQWGIMGLFIFAGPLLYMYSKDRRGELTDADGGYLVLSLIAFPMLLVYGPLAFALGAFRSLVT